MRACRTLVYSARAQNVQKLLKTLVPPMRPYSLSAKPLKAEQSTRKGRKHVQSINIYISAMCRGFPHHYSKIKRSLSLPCNVIMKIFRVGDKVVCRQAHQPCMKMPAGNIFIGQSAFLTTFMRSSCIMPAAAATIWQPPSLGDP